MRRARGQTCRYPDDTHLQWADTKSLANVLAAKGENAKLIAVPSPYRSGDYRQLYLPKLPGQPELRHSRGAQRRAKHVQVFLRLVEVGTSGRFGPWQGPDVAVLSKQDWKRSYSAPYGLPRVTGQGRQLFIAADYPDKLINRFEPVLLKGSAATRLPGELREYLDVLAAQVYLQAALTSVAGLRTAWLEAILAAYALYGALLDTDLTDLAARYEAWGQLELRGGEPCHPARAGRASFAARRWAQGFIATCGIAIFEQQGWNFADALRDEKRHKGEDAASYLARLAPSFGATYQTLHQI